MVNPYSDTGAAISGRGNASTPRFIRRSTIQNDILLLFYLCRLPDNGHELVGFETGAANQRSIYI